jgi:hypothetical protein
MKMPRVLALFPVILFLFGARRDDHPLVPRLHHHFWGPELLVRRRGSAHVDKKLG